MDDGKEDNSRDALQKEHRSALMMAAICLHKLRGIYGAKLNYQHGLALIEFVRRRSQDGNKFLESHQSLKIARESWALSEL